MIFELTNKYYRTPPKKPLIYKTKLQFPSASYTLTESELRDVVFKKDGQLNAHVNENLLDFKVRIPDIDLETESINRVLIYRNRVIVFVPGLLGSTIAIKTSRGLVQVYPNVYPQLSTGQVQEVERFFSEITAITVDTGSLINACEGEAAAYIANVLSHRKLGILECDSDGKPLFESKAELFRLLGAAPGVKLNKYVSAAVVYDVQDVLADRWENRTAYTNRPKDFAPFTIIPWAYDWRLDLEDSAQQLFRDLKQWQKTLQQQDDTDDLYVISGHSTGGVINRRVCGLDGIGGLVEHAFFMNVPFRGAPKALSVMLFGGDPPVPGHFGPMMPGPLIDKDSMVQIAENLPIVYYLSPSNYYPDVVSTLSRDLCDICRGVIQPNPNQRDQEKANLIQAATLTGIYQPVRSVPPSASQQDRARIAVGATEWHYAWWDCGRRRAYGRYWDQTQLDRFNRRELRSNENLSSQDNLRDSDTIGWNSKIAGNASRFHQLSESRIASSPVHLYIFWSQHNATTGSVDMQLDGTPEPIDVLHLGISTNAYFNDGEYPKYEVGESFDFRFQWWPPNETTRRWIKFTATLVDGDGTVPRASLLGIGTNKAKIFQPIPGDPAHVPAPNADFVWERVLDVLTGRDISNYLAVDVQAINIPYPA